MYLEIIAKRLKMQKYKIPNENGDLRRYALWKNLKYLLGYVIYIGVMAAAFLFFLARRHENAPELNWWVYPVYTVAVFVSGWFIFCMNRFVSDKSFCGKIVSIDFNRDFGRGINRQASFSIDDHTYIVIKAVDGKGKKRRIKVPLFEDGFDGYYGEGMTVVKYRGLNYPLVLESEESGVHMCAVCGVRTYYKEGKSVCGESEPERVEGIMICRSCRHTLIEK
jgi:hypothetical protein